MSKSKHAPVRGASGNPAKRPVQMASPVTFGTWVGGARLRTLPLAVAPVIAGTGAASIVTRPDIHWGLALLCLAVAVFLQIGVNYANDYSDGIRGTDTHRVGPARLTAGGQVNPKSVLTLSFAFFGLAAIAGLVIVILTQQWWLLAVGAVCIVAAWFYTGGKRPYGYNAMGELFVFVFFGLVATLGTTWVQAGQITQEAWVAAVGIGLLACAVLLANNLRDIAQDRVVGKRTLSVLIGAVATKILFTAFVLIPMLLGVWLALFYPIAWLTLLALLAGIPAVLIVWTFKAPRELIIALSLTSLMSLVYAGALLWAFAG